jgi:hypothetical protein
MSEPHQTTRPNGPDPGAPWDDWTARLGDGAPPPPRQLPDLSPLFAVFEAMRRAVPAELQAQLTALQREILLTIRALIDWYLERLDSRGRAPSVEDIPIE